MGNTHRKKSMHLVNQEKYFIIVQQQISGVLNLSPKFSKLTSCEMSTNEQANLHLLVLDASFCSESKFLEPNLVWSIEFSLLEGTRVMTAASPSSSSAWAACVLFKSLTFPVIVDKARLRRFAAMPFLDFSLCFGMFIADISFECCPENHGYIMPVRCTVLKN